MKRRNFTVYKSVRLGYALSTTLFNLTLEHVPRRINKGNIGTGRGPRTAYADDLLLVTKKR